MFNGEDVLITTMLLEESDRGCAIFGAQVIDDRLKAFLLSIFRQTPDAAKIVKTITSGYGPLSTFSARTDLIYALGGLEAEEYRRIHLFREIRNRMAHEAGPIHFGHERVAQKFRQLIANGAPEDPSDLEPPDLIHTGKTSLSKRTLINRIAFGLSLSRLCGTIDYNRELFTRTFPGAPLWHAWMSALPKGAPNQVLDQLNDELQGQGA